MYRGLNEVLLDHHPITACLQSFESVLSANRTRDLTHMVYDSQEYV